MDIFDKVILHPSSASSGKTQTHTKENTMSEPVPLPQGVIDAFHLMWNGFPEPVMLTHKSFQVVAVNRACAARGMEPGFHCNKIGTPEQHKGCLSQKCVRTGEAQYVPIPLPDHEAVGFWLPVEGHPEFFIHFGVGTSLNYKTGEAVNMYGGQERA